MTCFIRSAAHADIERQFRYYLIEREAPEVALRWLDAVEATVDSLRKHPGIGVSHSFPNLPKLRSWPVSEFEEIRVYYTETEEELRIVRILHGKRDLNTILKREDSTVE